nr:hypothetical protein Iba_chr14aCG19200 [Ipomoea batatas]
MPSIFSREAIRAILEFGDTEDALDKPFLPLGGLIPFVANSSICLRAASSSANAAHTWLCFSYS